MAITALNSHDIKKITFYYIVDKMLIDILGFSGNFIWTYTQINVHIKKHK